MDLGHTEVGAPELDVEFLTLPEDLLAKLARAIDKALTLIIEIDSNLRASLEESRIQSHFPELQFAELDYTGGTTGESAPPPIAVATRPWVGRPRDTQRPNVYYEPRVKRGVTYQRSMPLSPEEPRRSELQVGAIPLNVGGFGEVDEALRERIVRQNFSGRMSRGYLGPADGDFKQYVRIFGVSNKRWRWPSRNVAELDVTDNQYKLQQKLQRLFSGRGGITGDPGIKGTPQPCCFGRVFNVPGQRLSLNDNFWFIHPRAVAEIVECRDMGIPLVFAGTFSTFAALSAADLAAGEWAYTPGGPGAPAVARLAIEPADSTSIRFDVRGDVHPHDGYTEYIGQILLRLYRDFGYVDQTSLEAASFLSLPLDRAGWYLSSDAQPTLEEVADEILRGLYSWSTTSDKLKFQVRQVHHPRDGINVFTLRREDVQRWEAPVAITPRYAQPVLYKRNWGILTEDQIALDVDEEFATELSDLGGGKIVNKPRGFVLARDDQAIIGDTLISPFYDSHAAAVISETVLDIHDGEGLIDQIEVGVQAINLTIGKCGVFDFDAGDRGNRPVMVINQRIEIGGRNTLVLYG